MSDPNLLVGVNTGDDAAVYRMDDDVALIQTVDFFPPIVDDPYDFGQIAVANALSDVYAMGGKPLMALNIVGFPSRAAEGLAWDDPDRWRPQGAGGGGPDSWRTYR